jgi:hypothetical protein
MISCSISTTFCTIQGQRNKSSFFAGGEKMWQNYADYFKKPKSHLVGLKNKNPAPDHLILSQPDE